MSITSNTDITSLSASAFANLTISEIKSLSSTQCAVIVSSQLSSLPADKLAALPLNFISTMTLTGISTSAINGLILKNLSSEQIQALTTAQITAMSAKKIANFLPEQLTYLTTPQIAAADISALNSEQISALSASQLSVLSTSHFSALSNEALEGLTASNITGLSATQINALSSEKIAVLKPSQLNALSNSQFSNLNSQTLAAISSETLNAINESISSVSNLTPQKIGKLTAEKFSTFTPLQISSLTATQVAVLKPTHIAALSAEQASAFSTTAIAALKPQVIRLLNLEAFDSADIAALTTQQMSHLTATNIAQLSELNAMGLTASQINVMKLKSLQNLSLDAQSVLENQAHVAYQIRIGNVTTPNVPTINTIAGDNIVNFYERNTQGVVISGTADIGTTVRLNFGNNTTATVTTNANGLWAYQTTFSNFGSDENGGINTLSVVAVNNAGATSQAATTNFVVDVVAPSEPEFSFMNVINTSPNPMTSVNNLVFVSNLENGASWEYSIDGGATFVSGTDTFFSLPIDSYSAGTIKVKQIDAAGNVSAIASNNGGYQVIPPPQQIVLSGSNSVNEGSNTVYTVSVPNPVTWNDLTVSYTLSGSATEADYSGQKIGILTIPASQTTATLTLPIISDNLTEGAETLIVTLSSPSYGYVISSANGSVTTTINDTSVAPANQIPTFNNTLDNTPIFLGSPIVLDSSVEISDAQLNALNNGFGDFYGSTLTLQRSGGASPDDTFGLVSSSVYYLDSSTNTIKDYDGGWYSYATYTNTNGIFTINFNNHSYDESSRINAILSSITYYNTNPEVTGEIIPISWTFNDGSGGEVTNVINVTISQAGSGGSNNGGGGSNSDDFSVTGELSETDSNNSYRDGSYVDIYELTGFNDGDTIVVSLNATFDAFLQVVRNGIVISYDDDNGGGFNSSLAYTYQTGDLIYATSFGSGVTGSYTLTANRLVDDFPDSTLTTGTLDVSSPATGNIDYSNDKDWFAVSLTAGTTYLFTQTSSANYPFIDGLFNSEGSKVKYSDESNYLTFTPTTSGMYYLSASGEGMGSYQLSVNTIIDDFTNNTSTTGIVTNGVGMGNIDYPYDRDWFKISLTAGATYHFNIISTNNNASLEGIYNSAGAFMDYRLDFTPTVTGDYFIEVYGYGIGAYTLNAFAPPITPQIYNNHTYILSNANTSWQNAEDTAIALGGHLVTIDNQEEQDWLVSTFGGSEHFWIGLTDKETEGTFKWISNNQVVWIGTGLNGQAVAGHYTNWNVDNYGNSEPNNSDNEDYTVMNWDNAGKWNDLGQNNVAKGIIEISGTNTVNLFEDTTRTFQLNNFGFDIDGNLASVTITNLPASGVLKLGDIPVAISTNNVIPVAQIPQLAYTPPANANGTNYATIGYTLTDTENATALGTITLNVIPVNDVPVFSSGETARSIEENSSVDTVVYVANATDVDGDILFYSLKSVDDYAAFNINSETGEIRLNSPADYETKNSYSFTVQASDGIETIEKLVLVSVLDIVEGQ